MVKFGVGQSARRGEDAHLLRGEGVYVDDAPAEGAAHLRLLRSPYAHATILAIDKADALAAPGVLAVYTIADLDADGLNGLPCAIPLKNRDGTGRAEPPRPILARDRVRHVGEAIAAVVAETPEHALDAVELITVDYAPLPAAGAGSAALAAGAPTLHDQAPGNLCFDWGRGDEQAVEAAFARADQVVSLPLTNNRLIAASMETRGCVAEYGPDAKRFTLTTNSQGGYLLRRLLSQVFGGPKDWFRIVTPEVGGGFGMKIFLYPEQAVACFAARRLGRKIKWIADRSEACLSDAQGRAHETQAELALDADGRALALRVDTVADLGAYLSNFAPLIATDAGAIMAPGVYRIPALWLRVRGALSNTAPVDAYRGAGRPEAIYVIERLMEEAGRRTGLGAVETRRRNMIAPAEMPHTTATGETYDSGDFAGLMDQALAKADHAGFPQRQAASASAGKLRGFGFAYYIEGCAGGSDERAWIDFAEDGSIAIRIGTQDNGQGHRTAYAQIAAERLGLPPDAITIRQGDTDGVPTGGGTGASRSITLGGAAIRAAADQAIENAKRIAADALEADEGDIAFQDGVFEIVGTDRRLSLRDVVARAFAIGDGAAALNAEGAYKAVARTYPNGCHACEVEIDPETGELQLARYVAVDDFGAMINPMLAMGQVHGGVAQGLGQALSERVVYDEDGQLLSGGFMDYALPHANDLPAISVDFAPTLCTTNPLGTKGCGEAGSIAAPPAVIHAILDALRPRGVEHIDMPATPQAIWSALQAAASSKA